MLTLSLSPHYSVVRRILAPVRQQPFGVGVLQVTRAWPRPAYEFVLRLPYPHQDEAEALYGFMQYHQGDIPFWFNGSAWGIVVNPVPFGIGDGTRTEFYLNNRYITASTLVAYADTVEVSPTPSMDLRTGLVTFAAAPAKHAVLTATYGCTYKCCFVAESRLLQTEQQFEDALLRYEGVRLRESVP